MQSNKIQSPVSRKIKTVEDSKAGYYLKLAGVVLLLGFAGAFVYRSAFGGKQKPNLKQFASVGEYAAEETAKVIGKSGRIVMVYDIYDPKAGGPNAGKPFETQWAQVTAFKKRMSHAGSYTFAGDWRLNRPNMVFYSVWPPGSFAQLVGANPPDTTIVLFANPPAFTAGEKSLLQSRPGKLVVIGSVLPEVEGLAKERLAHLIIAARYPVPPATKDPESEGDLVRRVYARLTPDTVDKQ